MPNNRTQISIRQPMGTPCLSNKLACKISLSQWRFRIFQGTQSQEELHLKDKMNMNRIAGSITASYKAQSRNCSDRFPDNRQPAVELHVCSQVAAATPHQVALLFNSSKFQPRDLLQQRVPTPSMYGLEPRILRAFKETQLSSLCSKGIHQTFHHLGVAFLARIVAQKLSILLLTWE